MHWILLDEPVSALDVSVQAQILDLLRSMQAELGVAYVLVSHDLAVVASIAHQVLVLRQGQVIEQEPALQAFNQPTHRLRKNCWKLFQAEDNG